MKMSWVENFRKINKQGVGDIYARQGSRVSWFLLGI